MNAKLREFLDIFGFNYEFKSSTECYKSGIFDEYHHEDYPLQIQDQIQDFQ